jgi:hypothetical protein
MTIAGLLKNNSTNYLTIQALIQSRSRETTRHSNEEQAAQHQAHKPPAQANHAQWQY